MARFPAMMEELSMEDMQQSEKPTTLLLRIGTITTVAGGLLALFSLIIGSQPEPLGSSLPYLAFPLLVFGFYVLLGGLAVVVLHYVVRWINS
jgi:hypothetical protein